MIDNEFEYTTELKIQNKLKTEKDNPMLNNNKNYIYIFVRPI